MPGNEVDDRAHNFFAQEDLLSGHCSSQGADGSWEGLGNNLWVGSQRHIGLSNSNSKGCNLHQSDNERRQNSHPREVAHGLSYGQPSLDPELAKNHSQSQLQNPNGYIHTHQSMQTRQNEANFLGADSEPGQYITTSRGLSVYESHGGNSLKHTVGSTRLESSESQIGFDFLGRQQHMSRDKIGIFQSVPQQLSGFNDIQVLQQQAMLRKMQELHGQHNSPDQNPPIINGTPISPITTASNNTWPPNELRFPPYQGQTLSLMDLIPQQNDQYVYDVPVSNTWSNPNRYSHVSIDKHSIQQMVLCNNSSRGHEHTGPTDKGGSLSSRHEFEEANSYGKSSGQGLPRGTLGNPHLVNSLQMEGPVHELSGPSETLPVSSSQSTVALDPTEEKFLFGDDNIWDSFENGGDVGVVGGSWSALVQSAVAETSRSDISSIQNTEVAPALRSNDANINLNYNINKNSQVYQNTTHSSPWVPQKNVPYHNSGQLYGEINDNNEAKTQSSSGNRLSRFYEKESKLQKRMVHGEMGQGVHMWKSVPDSQSTVFLEQVKIGNGPQLNRGFNNDLVNVHGTDKTERKENSSDSHDSNISQHTAAAGSDNSNTRNFLGEKQKLPGHGGQKVSAPRKFQHHPMGNLDEDVQSSLGRKFATNNQSHGDSGQSKIGQFHKMPNKIDKGNIFSVQQNKMGADDSPSSGTLVGFAPNTSAPIHRGFSMYASDKTVQSSQNVLKVVNNVDQFKENSNSEGSLSPLKQSQSPSHGFGFQLGFASKLLTQNHASSVGPHTSPKIRENSNTSLNSSEGEVKTNDISETGPSNNDAPQFNVLGNLNSSSSSEFSHFRNPLQGQQMIGAVNRNNPHSLQTGINQKDRPLSSGAAKEISLRKPPNAPTSQHNLMGGQSHNKFLPNIFHPGQLNNNAESPSYSEKISSPGEGNESVLKKQSDSPPSNSASTERDFEAFGRSLKPNNLSHSTYSLLNQMRAIKSTEMDTGNRGLERFKGPEQSDKSVMVGGPKIPSFIKSADTLGNKSSSQVANAPSQDVLAPDKMKSGDDNCSNSTSSVRVEHLQISLQMAPSWFEQYGTFKNGQMLPPHDTHKYLTLKNNEQRVPLGKSSDTSRVNTVMEEANADVDSNRAGNNWKRSISTPVTVENLSSSHLITKDVVDKGLVVASQKKRKTTATLPSWDREVTQSSQNPLTTSMADTEWAEETNRLIEKVEVEPAFEDVPPKVKSKRRLVFTTQLMQQIFRPPVAATLYADAYSNNEAVSCMSARLALVDACNLIPRSKRDSYAPTDCINSHISSEPEKNSDQHIDEVTKHFIGRAKKVESDFVRLDKRTSLGELRVESQELETLSMMYRFDKFHGHSEADLAPPAPQRYVNAQPAPRDLPEGVQCLSL